MRKNPFRDLFRQAGGRAGGTTGRSPSVRQRIIVLVASMALIVVVASGAGLAFSAFVEQALFETRLASDQYDAVARTRQSSSDVTAAIDRILIYRQPFFLSEQATGYMTGFQQNLDQLEPYTPADSTVAEKAASQAQIDNVKNTGASLIGVSRRILQLADDGEWEQAESSRQIEFAIYQRHLDESLQELSARSQAELVRQQENTLRLQRNTNLYLTLALVAALLIAAWMGLVTLRSITRPVQTLTEQTRQVMRGDFSPVAPLTQQDELGELSRAFAQMTDWLRDSYEQMEQRVAARTEALQRRTAQIQTAAEVASELAHAHTSDPDQPEQPAVNMDDLLDRAAGLIHTRFDLCLAAIYLLDPERRTIVLSALSGDWDPAATGPAGQSFIPRMPGEAAAVQATGPIGQAIEVGTARVRPGEADFGAQVVLPLQTGSRQVGVLLVQAAPGQDLEAEDVHILEIVGDQLAAAIQNLRLLEEVRNRLQELEGIYGAYSRSAWGKSRPVVGYEYDRVAARPLFTTDPVRAAATNPADQPPVEFPLEVRGVPVGVIAAWPAEGHTALTAEQAAILSDLSSRLGQVMETARLFTEAQSRALREQTLNQFSTRLVQSLDIESLLRAAVDELGRLAPVTEASVHIGLPGRAESGGNGAPVGEAHV